MDRKNDARGPNEPINQETVFSSPDADDGQKLLPAVTDELPKLTEGFKLRQRRTAATTTVATQTPKEDGATQNNITASEKEDDDEGKSNDSDESVESDYYYDDHGKSHTYYRTKKRFDESASFRMQSIGGGEIANSRSQVSSSRKNPQTASISAGVDPTKRNSTKRKVAHPEHNGSIYLAPAAVKDLGVNTSPPPTSRNNSIVDATAANGSRSAVMVNESMMGLPDHLRGLGSNIRKLTTEELLHISAMVSRKANREVYSVLQYTGEAWYLPEIRRTRPEEKEWQIAYIWGTGLVIAIAGRRLRLRLMSYALRICIMGLIWFIVWSSTIPKSWSYRVGYFLDPYVTILISAIVGGLVCRLLQIPPLLGVLWMGIIWNNIPHVGYFTSGILPEVRTIATRSGLALILIRCGYSISLQSVKPIFRNCCIAMCAFVCETIAHALMAQYYLEYDDWKWSFCQGLLGAIPSAAILVPGILLLQADGYSRSKGPLPLMLATMGMEAPIGIWAVNFVFGLISSDKEIGFAAGMGPVQIVGGAVAGCIAGATCHLGIWLLRNEAERLPGTKRYAEPHLQYLKWMSVFIIMLFAHGLLFLGYQIDMAGGGVVATTALGFCISHTWTLIDDEWLDIKKNVAVGLASVWDLAAMPYLFALVGSKINLSTVFNRDMFPKALLVFVVSVATRIIYTIFVPSIGLGFSWEEKIFHGIGAGFPKATVQIAMAGSPLDYVTKQLGVTSTNSTRYEVLQRQIEMATMFQTTIILFVLIGVPIASIWMTRVGPRVLHRE